MLWRDAPSTDEEQQRRLAVAAGLPPPASLARSSSISFFLPASFRLVQRERRRERRKGRWVQGQLSSSPSSCSLSSSASASSSSLTSVHVDQCLKQRQQRHQQSSSSSLSRASQRPRSAASAAGLSRSCSAPGCGTASSTSPSSSASQKFAAGIRHLKLRCAIDIETTSGSEEREPACPGHNSYRCTRKGCIACESLTSALTDCGEPSLLEDSCCGEQAAAACGETQRVLPLAEDACDMHVHVIDIPAAVQQTETQAAAAAFNPLSSCSSSSTPRLLLSASSLSLSRLLFSLSGAAGALLSVGLVHLVLGIFLLLVSSHYASQMAAESLQFPLAFVLPGIVLLMGLYGVSLSCVDCYATSSASSSSSSSPRFSSAARELHEHGARFMVLSFFLSSLLLLFSFYCFFTHEQRTIIVSAAEHDAVLAVSLLFLLTSMLLFASLFLLSRAIVPAFIDYASSSPFSPSHMRGWGASMRKHRSESSSRSSIAWYADRLRARQERKRDNRQRVAAVSSGKDSSDTAAASVPLMSCVADM